MRVPQPPDLSGNVPEAVDLLQAARDYAAAEARLNHHSITERDVIERNRAERLLKEAAVAFADAKRAVQA